MSLSGKNPDPVLGRSDSPRKTELEDYEHYALT